MSESEYKQVDVAAVVYLTLSEIIERYKIQEDSDKADKDKKNSRAMHHMKGLFTGKLVVPVRAKISKDYINNFMFFDVLGVHKGFAKQRLHTRELQDYLFGYREKCKYTINLDGLRNCFLEEGEEIWEACLTLPEKIAVDDVCEPEMDEKGKKKRSWMYRTETLEFSPVVLNKDYVLEAIAKSLLKSIRNYWKKASTEDDNADINERNEAIEEDYRDICVSLALYEIFLKEFYEDELGLYWEYQAYLHEVGECFELLFGKNHELSEEEKEDLNKRIEKIRDDREQYWLMEEMYAHEILYIAVTKCVSFIELLNMEVRFNKEYKTKVTKMDKRFQALIFEHNGNDTLNKAAKDMIEFLDAEKLFEENSYVKELLDMNLPSAKKIFKFLNYIRDNRKISIEGELKDLAWEITCSVYNNRDLLMKLNVDEQIAHEIKSNK